MVEINLADPDARAQLQHGDVVRYDGPAVFGPGGAWQDLLGQHRHPAWAYLPEDKADEDAWALLTGSAPDDQWEIWWDLPNLPPRVTLVLRGGKPVPAAGEETTSG
jgi:hypothetical protein